jgi:hypothetical protein
MPSDAGRPLRGLGFAQAADAPGFAASWCAAAPRPPDAAPPRRMGGFA